MPEISFKFDLDEKVKTPFGDEGFVCMLGFDEAGTKAYVKTKDNSDWFKESQLTLTPVVTKAKRGRRKKA